MTLLPNNMPEEADALGVPLVGRLEIARPGDQVLADDILVQVDAQARSFRDGDVAVSPGSRARSR